MTSARNVLVIVVLSSVQLVMTSQPSRALDDQYQILSSSNMIRESAQRNPDRRTVFMKRGLSRQYHRIPVTSVDYDSEQDSYNSPSAVEKNIRPQALHKREMVFYDDGHPPAAEKSDSNFYFGIIAIAVKKIMLMMFSIFVLPVVLFKILAFILIPIKFLIGMKALGVANTVLLGLLFLKQALTPVVTFNPTAIQGPTTGIGGGGPLSSIVSAVTSVLPLRNGDETGANVVKNELVGAAPNTSQNESIALTADKSNEEVEEEEEDEYGFL